MNIKRDIWLDVPSETMGPKIFLIWEGGFFEGRAPLSASEYITAVLINQDYFLIICRETVIQ